MLTAHAELWSEPTLPAGLVVDVLVEQPLEPAVPLPKLAWEPTLPNKTGKDSQPSF